jgi:hypothetical protein
LSWSRFFYRASSFPSSLRHEHGIHVTAFYVLVYSGQNGVQKPYHIQHIYSAHTHSYMSLGHDWN